MNDLVPGTYIRGDELDVFVFDQVRTAMLCPDPLLAGEAAVSMHRGTGNGELLAAQAAQFDRKIESAVTERRWLADLYQCNTVQQGSVERSSLALSIAIAKQSQSFINHWQGTVGCDPMINSNAAQGHFPSISFGEVGEAALRSEVFERWEHWFSLGYFADIDQYQTRDTVSRLAPGGGRGIVADPLASGCAISRLGWAGPDVGKRSKRP